MYFPLFKINCDISRFALLKDFPEFIFRDINMVDFIIQVDEARSELILIETRKRSRWEAKESS